MLNSAARALEWGGLRQRGGVIGERLEHGAGAVGAVCEEKGERVFQSLEAVVWPAWVAVDAIKKRGDVDELVSHIDELKIEKFFFTRHGIKARRGFWDSHHEAREK